MTNPFVNPKEELRKIAQTEALDKAEDDYGGFISSVLNDLIEAKYKGKEVNILRWPSYDEIICTLSWIIGYGVKDKVVTVEIDFDTKTNLPRTVRVSNYQGTYPDIPIAEFNEEVLIKALKELHKEK